MPPVYEHTHRSITSAAPIGCNAEIKATIVDYMSACIRMGMANTLPNILIATKLWHEGYSAESAIKFFGLGKVEAVEPPELIPRRTSASIDWQTFTARMLALAKQGGLVVDNADAACITFTYKSQLKGVILKVNNKQDQVWFSYAN